MGTSGAAEPSSSTGHDVAEPGEQGVEVRAIAVCRVDERSADRDRCELCHALKDAGR
jgi:hypothetical protein